MSVTAVPIRPLARGSVLKLWIGLLVLALAAAGLAWVGTAGQQVTTTASGLRYRVVEEGTGPTVTPADLVALLLLEEVAGVLDHAEGGAGQEPRKVEVQTETLGERMFSQATELIAGGTIMFILLFFLLASGDLFLRKLIRVLPSLADKKRAVEIARQIEQDVSTYLVTITLINLVLGLAVWGLMTWIGVPNPLLWGVLAFVTNIARGLFLTTWAYRYGADAISGFVHDAAGYAVLGLTCAGLLLLVPLLNVTVERGEPVTEETGEKAANLNT